MDRAQQTLVSFIAALAVGFVAALAQAQIRLVPTTHYEWWDCDGGTTNNVADGKYLVSFKDDTQASSGGGVVYECINDAGCANGGHYFGAGLTMVQDFASLANSTPVSCRSPVLTGDMTMTLIGPAVSYR